MAVASIVVLTATLEASGKKLSRNALETLAVEIARGNNREPYKLECYQLNLFRPLLLFHTGKSLGLVST